MIGCIRRIDPLDHIAERDDRMIVAVAVEAQRNALTVATVERLLAASLALKFIVAVHTVPDAVASSRGGDAEIVTDALVGVRLVPTGNVVR